LRADIELVYGWLHRFGVVTGKLAFGCAGGMP
jgi:hypothetical protein